MKLESQRELGTGSTNTLSPHCYKPVHGRLSPWFPLPFHAAMARFERRVGWSAPKSAHADYILLIDKKGKVKLELTI